jgi:hypothetical protein
LGKIPGIKVRWERFFYAKRLGYGTIKSNMLFHCRVSGEVAEKTSPGEGGTEWGIT